MIVENYHLMFSLHYHQFYRIADMMKSEPLSFTCPSCEHRSLINAGHFAPMKIFKITKWLICQDCGFERNTEDFKKEVLTV